MKKLWKVVGMDFNDNPSNVEGSFILYYGNRSVGTLKYSKGEWVFRYSKDFQENIFINLITDFPDINKEYRNSELWPFFSSRIPTLNQPFQLKKLKKHRIEKTDPVGLLKIFGNESINNPYRLVSL